MDADEKYTNLLQSAIDVWKFQIDSYWTRTSHFAVLELAFAAGLWKLFDAKHYFTSVGVSIGSILLTVIWVLNNARLHSYILHYWNRIQHYELSLGIDPVDSLVLGLGEARPPKTIPGDYHAYIQIIPVLFLTGWMWMLCWSICQLRCVFNIH